MDVKLGTVLIAIMTVFLVKIGIEKNFFQAKSTPKTEKGIRVSMRY